MWLESAIIVVKISERYPYTGADKSLVRPDWKKIIEN
jgi:hypothetical protein